MVLSMTGYGRAGALLHGRDIKVELRSVNARFFEYSSRLPRSCAFLEDKLKKLVASKVSRGKVELSLSIQTVTAADTVVTVNWQLAEGYRAALNEMVERRGAEPVHCPAQPAHYSPDSLLPAGHSLFAQFCHYGLVRPEPHRLYGAWHSDYSRKISGYLHRGLDGIWPHPF